MSLKQLTSNHSHCLSLHQTHQSDFIVSALVAKHDPHSFSGPLPITHILSEPVLSPFHLD